MCAVITLNGSLACDEDCRGLKTGWGGGGWWSGLGNNKTASIQASDDMSFCKGTMVGMKPLCWAQLPHEQEELGFQSLGAFISSWRCKCSKKGVSDLPFNNHEWKWTSGKPRSSWLFNIPEVCVQHAQLSEDQKRRKCENCLQYMQRAGMVQADWLDYLNSQWDPCNNISHHCSPWRNQQDSHWESSLPFK